jgi:hypothetical protein
MKARPSTQPPSSSYLLSRGRFASLLVLLFRVGLCLTCVSPRPVVARGDSLPDDKNDMSIEEATAGDNGANASCSLTMRPKDLSPELVYEILDYKGIFADVEEEEVCRVRTIAALGVVQPVLEVTRKTWCTTLSSPLFHTSFLRPN